MELMGKHKDGREIPVEVSLSMIEVNQGTLVASIIRDISDRKKAEQKVQKYQEELAHAVRLNTFGEMASSIAHELNQPLSAITMYASSLKSLINPMDRNSDELNTLADRLSAQALRSGEIIKQMRSFVSRHKPKVDCIEFVSIIRSVAIFLDADLRNGQTKLEVRIENMNHDVKVDVIQIQQVLINIIRNAIDAMANLNHEDRIVSLSADTDEKFLFVTVKDNGTGIPAKDLKRIFGAFYTTKPDGMGMGLAISQSIIESHGGILELSKNDDTGASFQFSLPRHLTA